MRNNIFVTAIGTDSGKTVVSALLCKALKFDYWKPVQCGHPTDSDTVRRWISHPEFKIYPEQYLLDLPASPHIASEQEEVVIDLGRFRLPASEGLVVEGAGGIMVPLNDHDYVIDLAMKLGMPVVLVANLYLGSINHTLLSIDYLKKQGFDCTGIIFNGEDPQKTKDIILKKSGLKELLHIKKHERIDHQIIDRYAEEFRNRNRELIPN